MSDAYTHALSLAIEHTSPASFHRVPALNELYASPESDDSRIALARFCHDMYRGDQLRHLPRLTGESSLEHSRRAHKSFLNVTRVVIDVLSQLYRRPITRKLSGDAAAATLIAAATASPQEPPTNIPSSLASRRVIVKASRSLTITTSSQMVGS